MKTDVIRVSGQDFRTEAALAEVDRLAAYKGLSPKGALHLRLLAEETMGLMRAITGGAEGDFWIEDEDGVYAMHLRVETALDEEKRRQLLSASTTGVNEAARGLIGRILCFFDPASSVPAFSAASLIGTSPEGYGPAVWSMETYRRQLSQYVEEARRGAGEAWDELEKSVLAHVADDVRVSMLGRTVEMVIFKRTR